MIEGLTEFSAYRERLFGALKTAFENDACGKSYEGACHLHFPAYHDEYWALDVDCYVIGPRRHYRYEGKTLKIVVAKAEKDLAKWILDYEEWLKDD